MPKKQKKDLNKENDNSSKEEPTNNVENFAPLSPKGEDEFYKIVNDFTEDICTTFPEYRTIIGRWWTNNEETRAKEVERVFAHCLRVIPERFFDILYQNVTIFEETSETNTEFLPGVVFKYLWSCNDVTEKTRETIWKYLHLLLVYYSQSNTHQHDYTVDFPSRIFIAYKHVISQYANKVTPKKESVGYFAWLELLKNVFLLLNDRPIIASGGIYSSSSDDNNNNFGLTISPTNNANTNANSSNSIQ